jgi:ribonuclease HI
MIRKIGKDIIHCQWLESLEMSNIRKVTFIFVSGHVGVQGNNRAVRLANCAVIRDGQPMDRTDIVNSLIEIGF